jgi:FkbM family methyltransferase
MSDFLDRILLGYTRRFPVDYGKKTIAHFIKLPGEEIIYTNSLGVKLRIDPAEYQMKQIYLYDYYEKNTIRHLKRLCERSFTFVDVGANIGFYSLVMGKLLQETGIVYSFEPNGYTYEKFKENIELNQLHNISLHKVGLSDTEKDVDIVYNLHNSGTASIFKSATAAEKKETIRVMKFDDFCNVENLENINLLKVDIEGSELPFLMGAEYALKQNQKLAMAVEMMDENCVSIGYTISELFQYIIGLGFKAYLPRPFPFGLKQVNSISRDYRDNIIFLRGY